RNRDGQAEREVATVDPNHRMRPHRHPQVQVAALPAALACRALARESHPRPGLHTRTDLHFQPCGFEHLSLAAAARAGLLDLSRPLAARAGSAHQPAGDFHLAAAAALRASLRPAARFRAAPLAFRAARRPLEGDLALRAEHRVAQIDFDLRLDVVARHRFAARPPGRALAPLGEEVAEHRAQVAEVGRVEAAAGAESRETGEAASGSRALRVLAELARLGLVEPGPERHLAELVVEGPLLGVSQHLKGRGDVLEALLGLLVA